MNSISLIAMHLEAEMKKCFWLCLCSAMRVSNIDHLLVKEQKYIFKGSFDRFKDTWFPNILDRSVNVHMLLTLLFFLF